MPDRPRSPWVSWRLFARGATRRNGISALQGLPALSLDALTSVAYGPQAIIAVLATAGTGAIRLTWPVTCAILVLLAVLVVAYCQVIDACPDGSGGYGIARQHLGKWAGHMAGAALIVDYVLTAAVSVAASVAALTSAFPHLLPFTVPLDLAALAIIAGINLRGAGESARTFMLPTAVFIVAVCAAILTGWIGPAQAVHWRAAAAMRSGLQPVRTLLILKAFAAGCTALTGVEAVANGVPLYRPPSCTRAKETQIVLGAVLWAMLAGLVGLVARLHVVPVAGRTILSLVLAASVGRGWLYYTACIATGLALGLAANTSFCSMPVLLGVLAGHGSLPRALSPEANPRGGSWAICAVAVATAALLVAWRGNTDSLIPLFAIGVYVAWTVALAGLIAARRRLGRRRGLPAAMLNVVGAVATGAATIIMVVTTFDEGAWVVAVAIPGLIAVFAVSARRAARAAGGQANSA